MSYFSIKLDTAVASVLSVEPTSCIVIRHGNSTAALSWKIQLSKEPRKQYFLKTTVEKNDMLKGDYHDLILTPIPQLTDPRRIRIPENNAHHCSFVLP